MPPTESNSEKPSILKDTRQAKGLTLEIVHQATKIPMDALRAIEEGYSSRILSPFYYRGFIKIYAEFLGLDVKEIYKQYGLDLPPKPIAPATVAPPSLKQPSRRPPPPLLQPNVIREQAQEWLSAVFTPKNVKLILKVVGGLFLLFLLFKMGGCIASHIYFKAATPKKKAVSLVQEKKFVAPEETEEEKPVVVVPQVKHEVVQARSEDDKVEVAVRAIRNTWLQVKADDKVVFQMTLSKGSMESWSGDKSIELSGRNINQLDMEVNGKHIGTLGGGWNRIRRVLITREGLTVKK